MIQKFPFSITSAISLFLFILPLCFAHSQHGDMIDGEFWLQIEPYMREGEIGPTSNRVLVETLLKEVRWVISGMIYGFDFVYRPSDNKRAVEEIFQAELKAEIPQGDPALRVRETRIEEDRVFLDIRYLLQGPQELMRRSWMSNTLPDCEGTGKGRYFTGPEEKITAYKEGMKIAIREYLRARKYNKPKEIRGELLLYEIPRVIIKSGDYLAWVKIKLSIKEIKDYRVY